MQTDKINVESNGNGMERALEEAMKFASYIGLDEKSSLTLRLLAEETLNMVSAITGDYVAHFYI